MNQNYDEIIRQMMREINRLKEDINRLSAQKPLFFIGNAMQAIESLTADQNNYDPLDYDILVLGPTATRTIHGFTGGTVGRLLYVRNQGSTNNLLFTHNNALAASGNKISTTTGATITLAPRNAALFFYAVHTAPGFWTMLFPGA